MNIYLIPSFRCHGQGLVSALLLFFFRFQSGSRLRYLRNFVIGTNFKF
jgi:hypothetical protein